MRQMQKTLVWSLCQKDPLEEEMVIHSSILAWKIPWTGETGGLQSMESQRVRHDWTQTHLREERLNTFEEGRRWWDPASFLGIRKIDVQTSYYFVKTYFSMINPFALGYNTLINTSLSALIHKRDTVQNFHLTQKQLNVLLKTKCAPQTDIWINGTE